MLQLQLQLQCYISYMLLSYTLQMLYAVTCNMSHVDGPGAYIARCACPSPGPARGRGGAGEGGHGGGGATGEGEPRGRGSSAGARARRWPWPSREPRATGGHGGGGGTDQVAPVPIGVPVDRSGWPATVGTLVGVEVPLAAALIAQLLHCGGLKPKRLNSPSAVWRVASSALTTLNALLERAFDKRHCLCTGALDVPADRWPILCRHRCCWCCWCC
jgi:hypothetical protein